MPDLSSNHKSLAPFRFHGVEFDPSAESNGQVCAVCPFCGKQKLYINSSTGQYKCFVCGNDGNIPTFIKRLWEESYAISKSDGEQYAELKEHRGVLSTDTFLQWGVTQSIVDGHFLVPGHKIDGKLDQLYRYAEYQGKMALLATPNMHQSLFGVGLYDPKKPIAYLAEGCWDAITLWEVLKQTKETDSGLAVTGAESGSLLADANVLAAPGCMTFSEAWLPLFAGKQVVLLFDSDHPKKHPRTGKPLPPAGAAGMQRAVGILQRGSPPPAEVHYIHWGDDGYDPEQKSGYDVRDALTAHTTIAGRIQALQSIIDRVRPVPAEWVNGATSTHKPGTLKIECLPCDSWPRVEQAWSKAFKWTPELSDALSAMFAVTLSTKMPHDPIWIKVISPPSSGKTALAEALSVARKYVLPIDSMTRLFSGYQSDKEGSENMSLAKEANDKTLIFKDGDTLLSGSNLDLVLSQFRALFDKAVRVRFGNKMSWDFEGDCSIILCGTKTIRKIDSTDVGERFIDIVIYHRIDDNLETQINSKKIDQILDSRGGTAGGTVETRQSVDMTEAMQLSGGYVNYLRENAATLLAAVKIQDVAEFKNLMDCSAKFIAHLRARPSKRRRNPEDDDDGREMSTRLATQLTKLALCEAVVLGKQEVDNEVRARVRKIVIDSSQGPTYDTTRVLLKAGAGGLSPASISVLTGHSDFIQHKILRFLKKIEVVSRFLPKSQRGMVGSKPKYRLTDKMRHLCEVIGIGED